MHILYKIKIYFVFTLICLSPIIIFAQTSNLETETQTLLNRLDLNSNTLQNVTIHQNELVTKTKELLNFYKNRNSVKHPIMINSDHLKTSERDLKWANNALNHKFVGQPAYPLFFCGETINWNSRPVPDNEWVWQLNRMYFWSAMGKVYTNTKDERYAKEWCYQLMDWVKKNPNDKSHKYAWRSIEAGIRGHRWTGLFHQFIQSEYFTAEVLVAFMNSCYEHAEFLMNTYSSKSNWGLMEAEGLAFIAFTFPEFKNSEKWKTEAIRRLNREINIQVYPDGHQRELAMGYHMGCINWFYRTFELAKLNGFENKFPESYNIKIEKMCEIPMKLGLPDGTNAQFGDSWAGKPKQYGNRFMDWSEQFNRDDFLYLATDGKEGKAPEKTAYALKKSGLYSLRSGWNKNDICMVLKSGPDGGYHSQPDNGTFTLYAGQKTLMPDSGSYIYHGDKEGRAWFRQTKVHQTLTLDGKDTKYKPKLLKWQTSDHLDILVVENAGYDNLTHRRSVFFIDKKYFIIVDEAIGTGIGDVDIHFQLAPNDAIYNFDNFSVRSDYKKDWNVLIRAKKQKGLELTEEEGQVSFEYTKKEPRPAFRYRIKKTDDDQTVRFVTLVAPYETQIPDINFESNGDTKINANNLQLLLTENGIERVLKYDLNIE